MDYPLGNLFGCCSFPYMIIHVRKEYIYIAWLSQPEKIRFGLPAKINYEKHVQYNAASAGTANAILDVI